MVAVVGVISFSVPLGLLAIVFIEPVIWPRGAPLFVALRLAFGICGLIMMVGFIYRTLKSDSVPRSKRGFWVAVLLLGNVFALPFFWFWYVRQPTTSR